VGGALMRIPVLAGVAAGVLLLAAAYGVGFATAAQPRPDRLKTVLAQMDAGSKTFRSAEATIQKQQFEKIVKDTTTESGTIYFLRNGGSTQVGAKFDPPNEQTLEYKNGAVRLYSAGTNHIDQYSTTGANQTRFETFLTLGFGASGSDLAMAWTITDQGTEKMSDGGKPVEVEKLDLVSKDASVRGNFTHITIWVDVARDLSLKQEFFTPSGDTQTAIYSNIRLNQRIDLKAFAIKCKGKCS
jgi:outer membrane lipoprotein-sorting protein